MSNNSMGKLRPRSSGKKPAKQVSEAFRPSSDTESPRAKTSLMLNKDKYDRLRVYSVMENVPLRDIFDEAMDWYIRTYLDGTAPRGKGER